MKKIVFSLFLFMFVLVACNKKGDEPGDGPTTNLSYQISYESSDLYDISISSTAKGKEEVSGTITPEDYIEIESIYANDIKCTLDETSFSFTMPEEDVTLKVNYEIKEIEEDDNLTLSGPAILTAYEGTSTLEKDARFTIDLGRNFPANMDNDVLTYVKVKSLTTDVIPEDALSGAKRFDYDKTYITSAYFDVDMSKINVGTAYLLVNDTHYKRTIVKKLEIAKDGTIYEDEVFEVTVTLDLSKLSNTYKDKKLRIQFNDEDEYLVGSAYPQYQYYEFSKDDTLTFTFKYMPLHTFSLYVRYVYQNEHDITVAENLKIDEPNPTFTKTNNKITVVVSDPE